MPWLGKDLLKWAQMALTIKEKFDKLVYSKLILN